MKSKNTEAASPVVARVVGGENIKKKNKNKNKKIKNLKMDIEAVKESVINIEPSAIINEKKKKKVQSVNMNGNSNITMKDTASTIEEQENKATENKSPSTKPVIEAKAGGKKKKNEVTDTKKLTSAERQKQELRSIYVGNVNNKAKRKDIYKFFAQYGKIETVRLRGAAVANPQMSKKESMITGQFHGKRTSMTAYVRFTEEDMVEKALEANGCLLMEKHIHVDKATPTKDHSTKLAVFVGNLSFEVEEEGLRSHFVDCGDIKSVRIIRDKKLSSGKGFGYVNFMSADAVEIALRLNNRRFMGRQLRVQRCQKKPKVKVVKRKMKKEPGKMDLKFFKSNAGKAKEGKLKKKTKGGFSGKKMMETKKFNKMKKTKGKMSKDDKKKLSVAHKLTGVKPKVKKTI